MCEIQVLEPLTIQWILLKGKIIALVFMKELWMHFDGIYNYVERKNHESRVPILLAGVLFAYIVLSSYLYNSRVNICLLGQNFSFAMENYDRSVIWFVIASRLFVQFSEKKDFCILQISQKIFKFFEIWKRSRKRKKFPKKKSRLPEL